MKRRIAMALGAALLALTTTADAQAAGNRRATGDFTHSLTGSGFVRTDEFQFEAIEHKDGRVTGSVRWVQTLQFDGQDPISGEWNGTVEKLIFVGNRAFLLATAEDGSVLALGVADNGEGAQAEEADAAFYLAVSFTPPPGIFELSLVPVLDLFVTTIKPYLFESGNIQVAN